MIWFRSNGVQKTRPYGPCQKSCQSSSQTSKMWFRKFIHVLSLKDWPSFNFILPKNCGGNKNSRIMLLTLECWIIITNLKSIIVGSTITKCVRNNSIRDKIRHNYVNNLCCLLNCIDILLQNYPRKIAVQGYDVCLCRHETNYNADSNIEKNWSKGLLKYKLNFSYNKCVRIMCTNWMYTNPYLYQF